jgi:hypothetical protein
MPRVGLQTVLHGVYWPRLEPPGLFFDRPAAMLAQRRKSMDGKLLRNSREGHPDCDRRAVFKI